MGIQAHDFHRLCDDLFGDTGHTRQKLSGEWELAGIIEKEVSQIDGCACWVADAAIEGSTGKEAFGI